MIEQMTILVKYQTIPRKETLSTKTILAWWLPSLWAHRRISGEILWPEMIPPDWSRKTVWEWLTNFSLFNPAPCLDLPLGLEEHAGTTANIYANRAPQTIFLQVSEERQRLTRFKHYILPFSGRQQYQRCLTRAIIFPRTWEYSREPFGLFHNNEQ